MLTPRNVPVNRDTIVGLYNRLHKARFTQGSPYPRNVLVQPGPLTCPPEKRSFDNPSYRIIDFGRGECHDGVDCAYFMTKEEMKKVYKEICNDLFAYRTLTQCPLTPRLHCI
jgi:hypothetical protein